MRRLIRTLYPHEVEFHRFEDCINYGDCVMRASKLKYKSFSCRGCEDYAKTAELEPCPVLSSAMDEYTYPNGRLGFDVAKFSKKLLKKMRELGIPTTGKLDD